MGVVLVRVALQGNGFGLEFEKYLGILAVGLPGTDIPLDVAADLLDIAADLLDRLVVADPDNALKAGRHLGIEGWFGTVD